jgi:hypothetical protein
MLAAAGVLLPLARPVGQAAAAPVIIAPVAPAVLIAAAAAARVEAPPAMAGLELLSFATPTLYQTHQAQLAHQYLIYPAGTKATGLIIRVQLRGNEQQEPTVCGVLRLTKNRIDPFN